MSKSIALVTYDKLKDLSPSDQLLQKKLEKNGYFVEPVVWSDESIDWQKYDALIIRSTWNYHTRVEEFKLWLNKLESLKIKIFNDLKLIRWNMDKHYLLDLEKKGVKIIPTIIVKEGDSTKLASKLASNQIIIKPTIGASAYGVRKISSSKLPHVAEYDQIIQPFMKQIKTEGEYSFMFFDGEFSHAVLKKPALLDFRTQSDYGASKKLISPPLSLITQAQDIIRKLDTLPLYARVDAIQLDGKLYLMELELIEPQLFFDYDSQSTVNFANALSLHL